MRLLLIVLAAFAATGCAVGNKHDYTLEGPTLALAGTRSVAVVAQDARPYVLTRQKTPAFVGLSRGGFGNPFDVTTASGRPLADDFAATIARSLQSKGFKATALSAAPAGAPDVRTLAARAGADRLALVMIHEWKSDTFMSTALHHELTLQVFDANGSELANNRIAGRTSLGGSAIDPPSHARTAVPQFYRKTLEELFAPDAIVKSLR